MPRGRLGVLPRPRGGDWLEDEIKSLKSMGVEVLVSLLTAEETAELDIDKETDFCAAANIDFICFPIADRGVPTSVGRHRGVGEKVSEYAFGRENRWYSLSTGHWPLGDNRCRRTHFFR
jgi:hypothetical protein